MISPMDDYGKFQSSIRVKSKYFQIQPSTFVFYEWLVDGRGTTTSQKWTYAMHWHTQAEFKTRSVFTETNLLSNFSKKRIMVSNKIHCHHDGRNHPSTCITSTRYRWFGNAILRLSCKTAVWTKVDLQTLTGFSFPGITIAIYSL